MTTEIHMIDRDEAIAAAREAENESEIDKLIHKIDEALVDLHISEKTLASLQETLAGKKNE